MRSSIFSRIADELVARPHLTRSILAVVTIAAVVVALVDLVGEPVVIVGLVVLAGAALISFTGLRRASVGPGYEVLAYEHEWEFLRADGSLVAHRKHMDVRFLHETVAVTDHLWGRGELAGQYVCSPGRVVDRIQREGDAWLLVSLGEVKRRGQRQAFDMSRTIANGFLSTQEFVEVETVGRPRRLALTLVFPESRPPEAVHVGWPAWRGRRTAEVAVRRIGDRAVVEFETDHPRAGSRYRVEWRWPAVAVYLSHTQATAGTADRLAARLAARGATVARSDAADAHFATRRMAVAREAQAIVLLVDGKPPSELQRAEWTAALEAAWGARRRAVLTVLVGHAEAPSALRPLRSARLGGDEADADEQLARVIDRLWAVDEPPEAIDEAAFPGDVPPPRDEFDLEDRARRDLLQRRAELERSYGGLAKERADPESVAVAVQLGIVLRQLGELEQARDVLDEAVAAVEGWRGPQPAELADAQYNLAVVRAALGDGSGARKLLEQAVELGAARLGAGHPKLAVYRSTLQRLKT